MKKLLLGITVGIGMTSVSLPVSAMKFMPVCPSSTQPGAVECLALVAGNNSEIPQATSTPAFGYTPAQLLSAYQLTGIASKPTTVGIVLFFDSPTIENDLNVYSSTFGLPACTTANGCFKKVNQNGLQSNYPAADSSSALELALDVEIVHAICQNCNILLVEANSATLADIVVAENTAVRLGATVVSNSFGAPEFSGEHSWDVYFNYPGIAITASSGDSGYGVNYPAASPYVTAVGGTTLLLNSDGTRQSETVWSGAGSGCSIYEPKPSWQPDTGCTGRTVADVSADANPNTGAAIYDSTPYNGAQGWFLVGGTSLSAPLIAGVYALGGNTGGTNSFIGASSTYSNTSIPYLYNVVTGSNGSCNVSYLCTAGTGYNGPTGFGTPIGTSAF